MHVHACTCVSTCDVHVIHMSPPPQVRSTLEGLVSGKQEEILALQQELAQVKVSCDKATREAQETRGLWEAEVRGCGVGVASVTLVCR